MNKTILIMFNILGLSCVFGGVFLNVYVFSNITMYGKITLYEPASFILVTELAMSAIGVIYFIYMWITKINELHNMKQRRKNLNTNTA